MREAMPKSLSGSGSRLSATARFVHEQGGGGRELGRPPSGQAGPLGSYLPGPPEAPGAPLRCARASLNSPRFNRFHGRIESPSNGGIHGSVSFNKAVEAIVAR